MVRFQLYKKHFLIQESFIKRPVVWYKMAVYTFIILSIYVSGLFVAGIAENKQGCRNVSYNVQNLHQVRYDKQIYLYISCLFPEIVFLTIAVKN